MRYIVTFLLAMACAMVVRFFPDWYYAPAFGLLCAFFGLVFFGMIFAPIAPPSSDYDDRPAPIYRNGRRIN